MRLERTNLKKPLVGGLGKGMELPLSKKYTILEKLPGHTPRLGKSAGEELNWAYRIQDLSSNEIFIGMFCKPNHITFIDVKIWDQLQTERFQALTWYYANHIGYIARTIKKEDIYQYGYLHQLIMDHCGNGKGGESIDHINQNKINNRKSNLRITSQSVQNQNRGKVARHKAAKPLPSEIIGPLPKFCVYYKENLNKEKTKWREFFTIEGHPKQDEKRKATTKSGKISIIQKLEEAKSILNDLDRL